MGLLFVGKDRRMIGLCNKLCYAIGKRDLKASDPKPTVAISTRQLIFRDQETLYFPGMTEKEVLLRFVNILYDRITATNP